MTRDAPGKDKEANWLPAPTGAFKPTMTGGAAIDLYPVLTRVSARVH